MKHCGMFIWLISACLFSIVPVCYGQNVDSQSIDSLIGVDPSDLKSTYRMAVLGDLHLPGRDISKKEAVIDTVNSWKDIDDVVVLGDVCATTGTDAEFCTAQRFLSALRKPLEVINGNHDFVFADEQPGGGHPVLAEASERKRKLKRFEEAYGPLSTHKIVQTFEDGEEVSWHFIFLGIDSLISPYYCGLSEKTQRWLTRTLSDYKTIPTVIFCHSPMWGREVLAMNPGLAHFTTQPLEFMEGLVKENPQIFLWVAGHAHLGAHNPVSTGNLNYFLKQVYNVNNCDLDGRSILEGAEMNLQLHSDIWTKTLEFHKDTVIIKVFDHMASRYLDDKEQTIPVKR